MSVVADSMEFGDAPAEYFGHSWFAMQHVPTDQLARLQLSTLQRRFSELRDQIPTLERLASASGIESISELNDVVPLLFQHSVYKSYPASLLLTNRFSELTNWLDRLTTLDLSTVDVADCTSIDSWLDRLESETDLRVTHSSITRFPGMALPYLLGSESRLHAMRPGRMSSDAAYLAGRVNLAAARGELDQLEINPALRQRREEFVREQREMAESLPRFIDETVNKLRGHRIWMLATWNVLYNIAKVGLDRGLENIFAPDSLVTTGGGAKGQVVPDDWEETVRRFIGVDHVQHCYVMSEITAINKMCEQERYHFEPWIVPFVLDPEDGTPSPREGQHTGRCGVIDLIPSTYWGGLISGDEVTLSFEQCSCGRTTPHVARQIERYSDKQGGDDKITCVAAEEAHRAALEFLTAELG
jgi:hypothetical protein